jgi:CheY-like chemotaxis protein
MDPKKILIVDDEVDLVETVRFPLEIEGYHVLVAYNGEEAHSHLNVDGQNSGKGQGHWNGDRGG